MIIHWASSSHLALQFLLTPRNPHQGEGWLPLLTAPRWEPGVSPTWSGTHPFRGSSAQVVPQACWAGSCPLPVPTPPTMDTCPEKVAVITCVQLSTHVHACGNSETKCEGSVPRLSPGESALSRPGRHRVCVWQLLPCASSLLTWSPGSMGVDSETKARGHTLRFYCPEVPKP